MSIFRKIPLQKNPGQGFTEAQQRVLNAFQTQEILRDQMCVVDYSLYDRCTVPPGEMTPKTFEFFHVVAGKTLGDTNMVTPDCLPQPQAFAINKSIFFLQSHLMLDTDRAQLLDGYGWEMLLGRKGYCAGPMAQFPNYCDTKQVKVQPFTKPALTAEARKHNQEWLAELERLNPKHLETPLEKRQFADVAINKTEQTVSLVIENGIRFGFIVAGKPFRTDPRGTGVNFMAVMDGLMAFGIQ